MSKPTPSSVDVLDPAADEPRPIQIAEADFDFTREPLRRPMGFKGDQTSEKWVSQVTLTGRSGARATAHGGFAVLWADERVFSAHSEPGANALMATVAEYGLQCAQRVGFQTPLDLQDQILTEVHHYACDVTRLPDLSPSFTLNALVGLDHAAWLLYAQERGLSTFDDFVAEGFGRQLPVRHPVLGCIPLISYTTTPEEIVGLVQDGYFFLKIKIGWPGSPRDMLAADKERLAAIFALVGKAETRHTSDGRVRFYLDANGRYRTRAQVEELLAFADEQGFLEQIALFEEPFAEASGEHVRDLPVTFAADESLHSVKDVTQRMAAGFRAVALKPAGKGLSATLRMAREAIRLGAITFVSDSACTPLMLDWNKNVASRLPVLPGMKLGLFEMNGQQNYVNWEQMLSRHPAAAKPWIRPTQGVFRLGKNFYAHGGGIFDSSIARARGSEAGTRHGQVGQVERVVPTR